MDFRVLCVACLLGCAISQHAATLLPGPFSFLVSRQFANIVELCNSDGTCKTVAQGLNLPQNVAWINDAEFLVADSGWNRVLRCLADGSGTCKVVAGTGTKGSKPNELYNPQGVVMLSSSKFLVADTYNHRVQLCTFGDKDCVTVAGTKGINGAGANQFSFPRCLERLDNTTFFVADDLNQRIQMCYASGGECTTIISLDQRPWGVSIHSEGYILLNGYQGDIVSCTVDVGPGADCKVVPGPSNVIAHDSLPNGDILVSNTATSNVELCSFSGGACRVVVDYKTLLKDKTSSIRGLAIKP